MTEFLITFRESIEAIMIVCIIRGCLTRRGQSGFEKTLISAVTAGVVCSGIVARGLSLLEQYSIMSDIEPLFAGTVMVITSVMLLQMLHWIHKGSYTVMGSSMMQSSPANCATCPLVPEPAGPHTRQTIKSILTSLTTNTHAQSGLQGVFFLIFFAILREGVETVLMLFGASSLDGSFSYSGFAGGLVAGTAVGYMLYGLGTRLPMKAFFTITSRMLLFFSAGMMAHSMHEFEEFAVDRGYISTDSITRAWTTSETAIDERLTTFVGRNTSPNYLEPLMRLLVMSYGMSLLYIPATIGSTPTQTKVQST